MFRDDFYRLQQPLRLITRQNPPKLPTVASGFWKMATSIENVLQQEFGIVAALQTAQMRTKGSERTSVAFNSRASTEMTLRALETVQETQLDFIQHVHNLMLESLHRSFELQPKCLNSSACRVDSLSDFATLLEKPLFYANSLKMFHQIGYSGSDMCDHHCYLSTWKTNTLLRSWVNIFHQLQAKRPDISSAFKDQSMIDNHLSLNTISTRLLNAVAGFGATEFGLLVFTLYLATTSSYWEALYSPVASSIRLIFEKQQNSHLGITGLVYSINNLLLASSLSYTMIIASSARHSERRKNLLWISDRMIPFMLPVLVLSRHWNEVVIDMHGFQRGFLCTAVWILLRGLELYPVYEVGINGLFPLIDDLVDGVVQRQVRKRSTSFPRLLRSHLAGRNNLSISLFIITFGISVYHAWIPLALAIGLNFVFRLQDQQELRSWLPTWARQRQNDEEEESEAILPMAFTLIPIMYYYSAVSNMAEFRDIHQMGCLAVEPSYNTYVEALKTIGLVKGPWV